VSASSDRKVILVTRETRLEGLIARYHTAAQAKFYVEHLGAEFTDYQREHDAYLAAKRHAIETLEQWGRYQIVDRSFLPSSFSVRPTSWWRLDRWARRHIMKYLDGHPADRVNPDSGRYDGVLLSVRCHPIWHCCCRCRGGQARVQERNDGESRPDGRTALYAVNDLFIGARSHTPRSTKIRTERNTQTQSWRAG